MLAIYKKELKSYFTSVIGCLFVAITALILGGFFVMYNMNYGLPYLMYVVSNGMLVLVFTIPLLTMKSIADEQKQKTDQLILTSPVSVGKVVLGKYLALCTIYVIPLLIACLYPLILKSFGSVPLKMSYTEILGMLLYGMAMIAIGMFISSITESQVIAAILSIVVLFLGYMMTNVKDSISTDGNIITKILGGFDLLSPAEDFLNGIINVSSIIYYMSIVLLFLFLTVQSIQKRKWSVSKNTISTGVFSTTFIAIAVAVTVFVNLIASNMAENVSWMSVDMTDQKMYTITDATKKAVKDIKDKITIYVLADESSADSTLNETLKRYKSTNKNISVEYKNTTKYPNFYADYTDAAPTSNSIIVVNETNKKSKVVDYNDIYETSMDYSTYQQQTTGYDGEGQVTSAISYVTLTNNPKVFKVTGHDESGVGSKFTSAIEKMNVDVEEVNLLNYDKITNDDCEMMLLLSPQKDYSKDEADKIKAYLEQGGKVLMTTAYSESDLPNFNSIADAYGVKILNGYVAENEASYYYQSPFYILANNGSGYASGLTNYNFMGYPQGMYIDKNSKNYSDSITYTELLKTSDKAVCKMNPNGIKSYEKEDGDKTGPFDLGISLTKTIDSTDKNDGDSSSESSSSETKTANLTIVASAYAFVDEFDTMVSGSNLELFQNIISDNVKTETKAVSIPVKSMNYSRITVTASAGRTVGIVVAIILPLGIFVAGIAIWTKRRKK